MITNQESTQSISTGASFADSLRQLSESMQQASPLAADYQEPVKALFAAQLAKAAILKAEAPEALLAQMRLLRGRLLSRFLGQPQALLLTSMEGSAGRTFVGLNLALMMGVLPELRVLLVDATGGPGSLESQLDLEATRGLWGPDETTFWQAPGTQLCFAACGRQEKALGQWLDLAPLASRLPAWRQRFDVVIVDAPPLLATPEAEEMSRVCDAALVVVRREQTTFANMQDGLARLGNKPLAGFVLNS
jgi:Mrp family chromosome partitioning ATPase